MTKLHSVLFSEHKSKGALNPVGGSVRVFIDNDYHYGYWVPETFVFTLLTPEQQAEYLAENFQYRCELPTNMAQALIDNGDTPYYKPTL